MSIGQVVPLKVAEFQPSDPQRFVQIDEDGYFKLDDLRVSDPEIGRQWLAAIQHNPKDFRVWTRMTDSSASSLQRPQDVIVESFDAPYVVLSIDHVGHEWSATMPYGHREPFLLETLSLDEWDRFHGRTERGIPFVFSRTAQAGFFDQLEEYDDESITSDGKTYVMPAWPELTTESRESAFWSKHYQNRETPWDLQGPHPALSRLASVVKLQRSRILILGCGRAHDAAWFARAGHIVTALDFSPEAIAEAKRLYGEVNDLTLVQGDAFQLPAKFDQAFDVVFDHTMYCATEPSRRNDLVKSWRRALTDNGHLLAIFFCQEKRQGPPYGGSEWELRQRLNKQFRSLYWQRLKDSPEARLGSELFVYSQKLPNLR